MREHVVVRPPMVQPFTLDATLDAQNAEDVSTFFGE